MLHELRRNLARQGLIQTPMHVDARQLQQLQIGVFMNLPRLNGKIGSLRIGLGTDGDILARGHGKSTCHPRGNSRQEQGMRRGLPRCNPSEQGRGREQAIVGAQHTRPEPTNLGVVMVFVMVHRLHRGMRAHTIPFPPLEDIALHQPLGQGDGSDSLSIPKLRGKRMTGLADFVGNTPLCELRRLSPNPRVRIFGKLEGNNPAGSVKDRPALNMIRRALERGEIRPGDRLVEATSGNTGIALAMAASVEGLKITLIMPENMSIERCQVMRAFGANIELTPAAASMEGAIDRARAMVAAGEAIMLDQFSNPDNPAAHTLTTGPEIWRDSRGQITHFISAMGTTGTIMGTGRYLRQVQPQIQIVGVQPAAGAKIPGIRRWPTEYLPKIFDARMVDQTVDIEQEEAEEMTRRLAREEGILAGISSGGAVAAALRLAQRLEQGFLVAIICDRGDRYLSTGVFPA